MSGGEWKGSLEDAYWEGESIMSLGGRKGTRVVCVTKGQEFCVGVGRKSLKSRV